MLSSMGENRPLLGQSSGGRGRGQELHTSGGADGEASGGGSVDSICPEPTSANARCDSVVLTAPCPPGSNTAGSN